jgi:hypothetical protein
VEIGKLSSLPIFNVFFIIDFLFFFFGQSYYRHLYPRCGLLMIHVSMEGSLVSAFPFLRLATIHQNVKKVLEIISDLSKCGVIVNSTLYDFIIVISIPTIIFTFIPSIESSENQIKASYFSTNISSVNQLVWWMYNPDQIKHQGNISLIDFQNGSYRVQLEG